MTGWIKTYLSSQYLLSVTNGAKDEKIYLFLPVALIVLIVGVRAYLFFKGNRPEIYKTFDRYWFWGFLGFSVFGLFIYFSRVQTLPIFSYRAVSYLWAIGLFAYLVFMIWYFKTQSRSKLDHYLEQKRKAKYLSK